MASTLPQPVLTYRVAGKRLFDLAVIVVMAPLLLAAIGAVALAVRLSIGAPVFFRQKRAGRGGRLFELIKFRTMSDKRDSNGELLPDEQRLGRFGRLLRSTSLDELPEVWNVLRGEMSLVGPRPLLPEYLPRYTPEQARRHDVPPGLTGWAQVCGRNAVSWERKFELDSWYSSNVGFWLDVEILFRTVAVVFAREGVSAEGHATAPVFMGRDAEAVAVIGAGGHAAVVAGALHAAGVPVAGGYDDRHREGLTEANGLTILGSIDQAVQTPSGRGIIAIGDNAARRAIATRLRLEWLTAIHPSAVVDPTATIGPGAVIMARAVVQAGAVVGEHAIINTGATVDHHSVIGAFAHIAPGANLAGCLRVGDGSLVGVGARVIPGVAIGEAVTVGAGAVVTDDLPDGCTAVGVPARVLRNAVDREAA
ncbi:MAG: NeuD/PglB/VioB family sugar acetyltransferase [Planctomycetota bacterium]